MSVNASSLARATMSYADRAGGQTHPSRVSGSHFEAELASPSIRLLRVSRLAGRDATIAGLDLDGFARVAAFRAIRAARLRACRMPRRSGRFRYPASDGGG